MSASYSENVPFGFIPPNPSNQSKIKIPREISERSHVEETFRILEKAVEQSIDGIAVSGIEGNIRFCNQAWADMHGYCVHELLGRHLSIFHTPEQMQKDVIPFNEQTRKDGAHHGEVGHIRKNGELFLTWMTTTLLKDEKGNPIGLIGIARDVTDRKKIADRLSSINKCFLNFGADPNENIDRLVSVCGKLMGATCALYNRLEGDLLCSIGKWNAPNDYNSSDKPQGHICYDVIKQDKEDLFIVRNLQKTDYARTDPNVARYKLQTYIGIAIKFGGACVGSLCVVYQKDFMPDEDERSFMQIIASAIAVEEERRHTDEALFNSEEQYRTTINSMADAVHVVDKDLRFVVFNKTFQDWCTKLGLQREALGKTVFEIFPFLSDKVKDEYRKVFRTGKVLSTEEGTKVGDVEFITETRKIPVFDGKNVIRVATVVRDITERKLAEKRQDATTLGLRAVVVAADELIACSDVQNVFLRAIEFAKEKLGMERCAIFIEDENGFIRGIFGTDRYGRLTDEHAYHFSKDAVWKERFKMLRPQDPKWFVANEPHMEWNGKETIKIGEGWVVVTPIQSAQRPIGVFVNDAAITKSELDPTRQDTLAVFCSLLGNIVERKHAENKLEIANKVLEKSTKRFKQLSLRDSHTGLYNHRYLQDAIESEFSRAKRNNQPLSVIMLDLDYFKSVNDVYGHQFGDLVLKQFARQLKRTVRKYDIIVRFGGEEFLIISPGVGKAIALALAQRVLDSVSMCNFGDDKHTVRLKLSIAVSSYPEDGVAKSMDLIGLADQILNKAKEDGGDRVYSFGDKSKASRYIPFRDEEGKNNNVEFLREKIDKLNKRANQSLIESIFAFARTIKLKDYYTGEHVENTVRYATEIARVLDLPRDDVEGVKQAAMVHDLGKIGISERILHKRAKLSDKEFNEIKKHPQIGADILRPIHFLHDIVPSVMYHHEKWDGTGYPSGLKGEEIPVGARIVAIADVYQALISDRPYRKAFTKDRALKMILDGAGTQFDPKIVSAFLRILPY